MNSIEATSKIRDIWNEYKHLSYKERGVTVGPLEAEIMAQWKAYLFDEQSYDLNETTLEVIFSMSWREGHASGLSEVEGYFVEFSDFARQILKSQG